MDFHATANDTHEGSDISGQCTPNVWRTLQRQGTGPLRSVAPPRPPRLAALLPDELGHLESSSHPKACNVKGQAVE